MTTVADTAADSRFVTATAVSEAAASLPLQREVQRLADMLLPLFLGDTPRCVHLVDLGGTDRASLWIAAAVGSALGVRLKTEVSVLTLEAELSDDATGSVRSASWRKSVVEYLPSSEGVSLGERLTELRAANHPFLLHSVLHSTAKHGFSEEWLQADSGISVVLLAHASRTRRAALQATIQRLELAGASMLGCILLYRTYPIPEKLYHLL